MIDEPSIHIDDVKTTIGSVSNLNRPGPFVGRSEEFFFLSNSFSDKAGSVWNEFIAGYNLRRRIAHKNVAGEAGSSIAGVDAESACGGVGSCVCSSGGVTEGNWANRCARWLNVFIPLNNTCEWVAFNHFEGHYRKLDGISV